VTWSSPGSESLRFSRGLLSQDSSQRKLLRSWLQTLGEGTISPQLLCLGKIKARPNWLMKEQP
jgi:hypothetical protein